MSKKQLGAAPGDESSPETGKRPGWFGRLRAQPGFRAAAVAFVLTVVLGIGSTVAYAYWGQRNTVSQSVTTVREPLPAVAGEVQCSQPVTLSVVRILHTKVAALPPDASLVASVVGPGSQTRLYAIPNDGVFALRDLPGLGKSLSWGDRISISVTTAYLDGSPGSLPAVVDEAKVLDRAKTEPKPVSAYYLASFFCS
ncbi:hypothetical protein [Arthrobacter sunyaminii]|uniref:hypothetical protein n=1 Tax=Arthrobacter sunyaminii TaxID=2816859 RepID=UPI001A945EAC|nr:hypothetical protein [Arthrobacter sunyaminii]MBO0896469.1 hypothetical protein [Arthrobacter sunyaminii]